MGDYVKSRYYRNGLKWVSPVGTLAAGAEDGGRCAELVDQLDAVSRTLLEETRGLTRDALRP